MHVIKVQMDQIVTNTYLGLKFSVFKTGELLNEIKSIIEFNKKNNFRLQSDTPPENSEIPEIYKYSNEFDIFVSDGRGLYLLVKSLGYPIKVEISLPILANRLLELAEVNQFKVLLLGADKETNKLATNKIKLKYPNAKVLDGIDGYFDIDEEQQIVKKINHSNPDIILVGISSKKERFVYKWKNEIDARIILPCGGVIDVLAGKTKDVPLFIKKMGIKWLFRFIQEPRRLFKPLFVNGLSVIFCLIPAVIYNVKIKNNNNFSIPKYYGVKEN